MLSVNFHKNGVIYSQEDLKNLIYNLFGFVPVIVSRQSRMFGSRWSEINTIDSRLTISDLEKLAEHLDKTYYTISLLFLENQTDDQWLMKVYNYFSDTEREDIFTQLF